MNEIDRIQDLLAQLCAGWHEHVEYTIIVGGHRELRGQNVYHPALLDQLRENSCGLGGIAQGGGTPYNKPGSRPPGNTAGLHLLDHIGCAAKGWYAVLYEATTCRPVPVVRHPLPMLLTELLDLARRAQQDNPSQVGALCREVASWVGRARIVLGYDRPEIELRDVVCGECGGILVVPSDASGDVRCIGTATSGSCGVIYPRYRWLEMVGA